MALAVIRNYDSFNSPTHFKLTDLLKKFDKTFGATKSAEVTEIADARVVDPSIQQLRRYTVADPARRFLHFPTDVINAFTPRAPEMICLTGKLTEPAWGYSLEHSPSVFTPSNPLGLSLFLLLSAGAVCALADEAMRASALAALGVLGFCFVMSPWGPESYLYSQN
jgi:hypothetical protein